MMRESTLVDKIIAAVEKTYGGFAWKIHGGRYQRKGMPDILYFKAGHVFAFEVKRSTTGYGATELQKLKLTKLAEQGVHAHIVTTVEEVLNVVQVCGFVES